VELFQISGSSSKSYFLRKNLLCFHHKTLSKKKGLSKKFQNHSKMKESIISLLLAFSQSRYRLKDQAIRCLCFSKTCSKTVLVPSGFFYKVFSGSLSRLSNVFSKKFYIYFKSHRTTYFMETIYQI